MYRFTKHKTLKGYIIIYVMFLGILCITMMLIGLKIELERRKNVDNIIVSTLKQSEEMKDKEYLFSFFKRHMVNNNIQLVTEYIKSYLMENYSNFKLIYGNSSLVYDKEKDLLVVTYPYDNYYNRVDYYKYYAEYGRLHFEISSFQIKEK